MRAIKFRAWNKLAHKMACITALDFMLDSYRAIAGKSSGSGHLADIELMQYTGLKDSKGAEIYEGDIVFDHTYKFNLGVTWCDGKGEDLGNQVGWWLDDGRYKVELCAYLGIDELDREEYANVSIIGNIYENGELLPKDTS